MKKFAIVFIMIVGWAAVADGLWSEENVRKSIILCTKVRDNPDLKDRMLEEALINFGNNTNAFVDIIKGIAVSDTNLTSSMLSFMRYYPITNSIPFLCEYVTNGTAATSGIAASSLFAIGGIGGESGEVLGKYLFVTNAAGADQASVCRDVVWAAHKCGDTNKVGWIYGLLLNSPRLPKYARSADESFIYYDSTYKFSKRRLALLRAAYSKGVSEFMSTYVTNAINELVAYPEANLSD